MRAHRPRVCIRLYSEADFQGRPRYTDPEILRTNLAAVILQMSALRLGEIESFSVHRPAGAAQCQRRGGAAAGTRCVRRRRGHHRPRPAVGPDPVDPRLGRMILQADTEGCLAEVLVLAAALSIPDPRERPAEMRRRPGETRPLR